jgi:hypothetical protein
MKTFACFLSVLLMLCSVAISQERIDIIYLKNGDIRKGVIVENVLNDYIKLETSDGSLFTIKYADIQKLTKEAKPAQAIKQSSTMENSNSGLMSRTTDFGITTALWLSGTVDYHKLSDNNDPKKQTGFLLKTFIDGYVAEKFSVGAYASFSPISWTGYSQGSTMFEFGISLKARFSLNNGAQAIKPGIEFGYRTMSSDLPQADGVKGMALNLSCEFQFDIHNTFVPFVNVGFLAQPTGGNSYDDIGFSPIVYLGAGVVF